MIEIHDLLVVFTAYVVSAASPGPSNMAIMTAAMRHGRRAGLALAGGVITMSALWGTIAATGLTTLLARYGQALEILKILGGLYLLWLGWKAARSAARREDPAASASTTRPGLWTLYRRGVLMHLGNPKSVLGWAAIMSLGLTTEASAERVAAALGGCILLGVFIFAGYALLFSTGPMVRAYARSRRWIEAALAAVFMGAGLRLLVSR